MKIQEHKKAAEQPQGKLISKAQSSVKYQQKPISSHVPVPGFRSPVYVPKNENPNLM